MPTQELDDIQLAYLEGFVQKCAAVGVDPEAVLASYTAKEASTLGRAVGGFGSGGAAGGILGGLVGAAGGAAAQHRRDPNSSLSQLGASALSGAKPLAMGGAAAGGLLGAITNASRTPDDEEEQGFMGRLSGGTGRGALAGAAIGGLTGGITSARSGRTGKGKERFLAAIRHALTGAVGGAAAGGAIGGVTNAARS